MKTLSRLGKLRGLMLVLPLVPAFFVIEHVGSEGFPEALGCSGSGSGSGVAPPLVSVLGAVPNEELSVATDGFVLLGLSGLSAADPVAALDVEVKTAGGDVVPGSLKALEDVAMVGWQADAPLPVGSKLSLTAKLQAYPFSTGAQLAVVGPPSELSADTLAFGEWVTFAHGVGDMVTCTTNGGSCSGNVLLTLPSSEESLRAVHATWTPPSVNGTVAWQARLELAGGAPLIHVPAAQWLYRTSTETFNLGTLVFPKDTSQYCGELVVKDLRTGTERRSKLCAEPQAPTGGTQRDYALHLCSAPPTPALKQAWCETTPTSPLCADSPGDPMPQEPNPEQPAEPNSATDDSAQKPNTSSGCQMAHGVPATGGFGLLLALGGLAAAWQRVQRPRRR